LLDFASLFAILPMRDVVVLLLHLVATVAWLAGQAARGRSWPRPFYSSTSC
jgi:hypothetical protein